MEKKYIKPELKNDITDVFDSQGRFPLYKGFPVHEGEIFLGKRMKNVYNKM